LKYWSDYDRVKLSNRRVSLDFFRPKKIVSVLDLVRAAKQAEAQVDPQADEEQEKLMAEIQKITNKRLMLDIGPNGGLIVHPEVVISNKIEVTNEPPLHGCVPMPLGKQPPPRVSRWKDYPKQLPAWMEEQLQQNEDPRTCAPLGSAASLKRAAGPFGDHDPGIWATLEAYWDQPPVPGTEVKIDRESGSVEAAKDKIRETFSHEAAGEPEAMIHFQERKRRPEAVQKKAALRSQELEFIRKNRRGEPKRDNLVDILGRSTPCELIDRPVKKVQGHV
jgi:hypothetical protein